MARHKLIGALVAITAPSASVELWAAVPIGLIAGAIVPLGVYAIDRASTTLVGALTAHGLCGVGSASPGGQRRRGLRSTTPSANPEGGLFASGLFSQLIAQAALTIAFSFVFAMSFATFYVIKKTYGLRVTEDEEEAGLDITEHGMAGYLEQFIPAPELVGYGAMPSPAHHGAPPAHPDRQGGDRVKKIEAYIRHEAFEPIRLELLGLGFPSLTITEAKVSRQEGTAERYRAELTNYLRPKASRGVAADRDVQTIDTILKHGRTGAGRRQGVFVLPVEESYRVRPASPARTCCRPTRTRRPQLDLMEPPCTGGRAGPPPRARQGSSSLREVHLAMLDAVLAGDGLARVAALAAGAVGAPAAIVVPRPRRGGDRRATETPARRRWSRCAAMSPTAPATARAGARGRRRRGAHQPRRRGRRGRSCWPAAARWRERTRRSSCTAAVACR